MLSNVTTYSAFRPENYQKKSVPQNTAGNNQITSETKMSFFDIPNMAFLSNVNFKGTINPKDEWALVAGTKKIAEIIAKNPGKNEFNLAVNIVNPYLAKKSGKYYLHIKKAEEVHPYRHYENPPGDYRVKVTAFSFNNGKAFYPEADLIYNETEKTKSESCGYGLGTLDSNSSGEMAIKDIIGGLTFSDSSIKILKSEPKELKILKTMKDSLASTSSYPGDNNDKLADAAALINYLLENEDSIYLNTKNNQTLSIRKSSKIDHFRYDEIPPANYRVQINVIDNSTKEKTNSFEFVYNTSKAREEKEQAGEKFAWGSGSIINAENILEAIKSMENVAKLLHNA